MRRSNWNTFNVTTTAQQIAGQSPMRRAVVIGTNAQDIFISTNPAVTATTGLRVVNGMMPLQLCCQWAGDWIAHSLFAITSVGTANVYVVEAFDDGDIADAAKIVEVYGRG